MTRRRSSSASSSSASSSSASSSSASSSSASVRGSDPRIPEKKNFRIGEVAEIASVEAYVLRFWETEFPSLRPAKSKSNQRTYAQKDVQLVLRIRDLLYEEGFTIEGARKQLKSQTLRTREVPARTRAVLDQVKNEVHDLLQLVEE